MITNEMRPIMAELEKKMHLKTVKGQLKGYFESSMEPVRCWEEHSKHIETLMGTVLGDMKGGELKVMLCVIVPTDYSQLGSELTRAVTVGALFSTGAACVRH